MNSLVMLHHRNIAIVGHIDSGKTTLTDRLLFHSDTDRRSHYGNVDSGTTQTDIGIVEKLRGITIHSVPVKASYTLDEDTYELTIVDTPGHPEFEFQVKTTLDCVEGALLLIDMKDGVRNHTVQLLNALKEANLPTILIC